MTRCLEQALLGTEVVVHQGRVHPGDRGHRADRRTDVATLHPPAESSSSRAVVALRLLWHDGYRPAGVADQPGRQGADQAMAGAHRGADDDRVDPKLVCEADQFEVGIAASFVEGEADAEDICPAFRVSPEFGDEVGLCLAVNLDQPGVQDAGARLSVNEKDDHLRALAPGQSGGIGAGAQ